MNASDRAEALVALVRREAEARCAAVLEPARHEARRLVAEGRKRSRARVRAAIAEERVAFAQRVAAAEARLATARRMQRQGHLAALLARAQQALPAALERRWDDAAERREWMRAAVGAALAVLTDPRWEVEAPASLGREERDEAMALARAKGVEIAWRLAGFAQGLRIRAGKVLVDATPAGLLAEKRVMEGRLATLIEEAQS